MLTREMKIRLAWRAAGILVCSAILAVFIWSCAYAYGDEPTPGTTAALHEQLMRQHQIGGYTPTRIHQTTEMRVGPNDPPIPTIKRTSRALVRSRTCCRCSCQR